MVWMTAALAGSATLTAVVDEMPPSVDGRMVCELQLMGDGRALAASGDCGDALLTAAAGAFEPSRAQAVGMWPHPAVVLVDSVKLQQARVVSNRRGTRLQRQPAARVERWAGAQGFGPLSVIACDVALIVAADGTVEAAEPVDCPLQAEAAAAGMAWRFQPLMLQGEAVSFEALVVVPVSSVDSGDGLGPDLEAFEPLEPNTVLN